VTVAWPAGKTTQTFRNLRADEAIEITEGADSYRTVTRKPLVPRGG